MRRYVIENRRTSAFGTFIKNVTVASEEVSQTVTRTPWPDTVTGRMR